MNDVQFGGCPYCGKSACCAGSCRVETPTIKPATGATGHLLRGLGGKYCFRVYGEDFSFVDYDLLHYDLVVTIVDKDAYFYSGAEYNRLAHAPITLGIKE